MDALKDQRVADYFNENFTSTYLKVGTFQVVNGQKQGGNVASYFCLGDGSVVHAIAGKVDANTLLNEARWAYEIRKSALDASTTRGERVPSVDARKYGEKVRRSHAERYNAQAGALPRSLPRNSSQQLQVHWLLGTRPMAKIDSIYPIVWEQILREKLSTLPVERK